MRRAATFLLVLLAACPGGKPAGRERTEPPARGGVLTVAIADDADFLDPQRATQPQAVALMRAMHRGLMAFPAQAHPRSLEPVPDLAAAPPQISADGLVYTFSIRAGAAFGPPASRPVAAADVRAGLLRLLVSDSPLAQYYKVIAAVAAPDERTVVLRLARPSGDIPWILAHPAASAVPVEIQNERRVAPERIAPSGPYRLASGDGYRPERSIRLVRNPAWKAESDPVRPAYVDEIRVSVGGDGAEITRRIDRAEADLSLDTPPAPGALGASAEPTPGGPAPGANRVVSVPSGCLRYLWMNTAVEPFGDVRVRRAVAAAVDRTPLVDPPGGAEAAIPTGALLVRGLAGAPDDPTPPARDPAAAAAIFRSLPSGTSGTLVAGDRPVDQAQAQAIVAALRAAGSFAIRVSTVPIASLYVDHYEIPSRRVPMGIATWCADWPGLGGRGHLPPLLDGRRITRTGNTNYAMLRDAGLNALMDRAAAAAPAGAAAAWREAADRAIALGAIVPLLDLNEVSLLSSRVGVFVAPAMFPRGDLTAISIRRGAPEPGPSA